MRLVGPSFCTRPTKSSVFEEPQHQTPRGRTLGDPSTSMVRDLSPAQTYSCTRILVSVWSVVSVVRSFSHIL